jgi:tRNA dimethylallyltransferase
VIDPTLDLICILGPTASGKTRLAARLAHRLGGEILSVDSRQVYRGMDCGTGKDLVDYRVDDLLVPYHLIDIVECGADYNVFRYQNDFFAAYRDIRGRGAVAIACGGTGLYLDAVLSGYLIAEVKEDPALRAELACLDNEALIARLHALRRPHNVSDTRDRARLIRAIEIATTTAQRDVAAGEPLLPLRSRVFGLTWPRQTLHERIDQRLEQRLNLGLIEEVRSLLAGGLTPAQLMFYGLEYRFVTLHVTGQLSRNDMKQRLASAIHAFAKRQETWFRRMERRGTVIDWLDARVGVDCLVDQILEKLAGDLGQRPGTAEA